MTPRCTFIRHKSTMNPHCPSSFNMGLQLGYGVEEWLILLSHSWPMTHLYSIWYIRILPNPTPHPNHINHCIAYDDNILSLMAYPHLELRKDNSG